VHCGPWFCLSSKALPSVRRSEFAGKPSDDPRVEGIRCNKGPGRKGRRCRHATDCRRRVRQSVDGDSVDGYDRDVAISTYETAAGIVPAVRSEHDSRIEIVAFAGRSLDAKRARYQVSRVATLSALRCGYGSCLKCRQGFGASRIKVMWRQVDVHLRGDSSDSQIRVATRQRGKATCKSRLRALV
jgi:hypothetical protein